MQFTIDTFRRNPSVIESNRIGKTQLTLRDEELVLMRKLAKRLSNMNQSQLAIDVDPDLIQIRAPLSCGKLKDCKLQLALGLESDPSSFQFTARQSCDDSPVFTRAVQIPGT
ncbi:hypothetical protein N9M39_00075 [Halieaceae bacterium]|nr:hypothetical protein [Halieaceae bacterium]